MSKGPIIRVSDVDYDGPTAVELRRNVIALRNKALNPESFEPEAAVILSHTVALLAPSKIDTAGTGANIGRWRCWSVSVSP
jgi:hypothetical protein